MKKFYLTLVALFAFTMVATAGVRNLYKQDFESVSTPQDAGWNSPNLAGGMSIQSTEFGQWFRFSLGANNNRNASLNFNNGLTDATIFTDQDVKEYTVRFQWGFIANANAAKAADTQFSTELALLGGKWDPTLKSKGYFINNGQYATADSLCIFSMTQLKGAWQAEDLTKEPPVQQTPYWTDNADLSSYATDFYFNNDKENVITLTVGMWYDIIVTVNTETKTTKWSIAELDGEVLKTGESTLAENCDPFVKGLNVLQGRQNSVSDIDEIKVQVPTEGDYANTPTISLTEVDMAKRSFDIYFEDGEILHVKKTDGTEDTAVESPYKYETETSGTLEVWTESGAATSEHVTYEVVAEPIALPAAKIDITKVNSGYVKTLLMTVNNSTVPTQPQITLTWEYSNGDASTGEVASGAIYNATEKGTLKVTTHAYGFVETTTTFENNTEFAIDKTVDFQHMTEDDLTAKGFSEIDELRADKMSGEGNWTARSYMWFGIENGETNDDGSAKYDKHVVYGPTTNAEAQGIRRFLLVPSKLTADNYKTIFAPLYVWYGEAGDGTDCAGFKMNYNIGLINTGVFKDDQSSSIQKSFESPAVGVDGLTDNDYYIVYWVSNYGNGSEHPIFPAGTSVADATEQYKAMNIGLASDRDGKSTVFRGTETFGFFRIDSAISCIEVFKSTGESGIKDITGAVVSDHNAPIYNLNGVRVDGALKKGIYIKQGKKFIVK